MIYIYLLLKGRKVTEWNYFLAVRSIFLFQWHWHHGRKPYYCLLSVSGCVEHFRYFLLVLRAFVFIEFSNALSTYNFPEWFEICSIANCCSLRDSAKFLVIFTVLIQSKITLEVNADEIKGLTPTVWCTMKEIADKLQDLIFNDCVQ